MAKFKYFGTVLSDQNFIHEETKSRINSGNASYHSVQINLSSHLISKNLQIKNKKKTLFYLLFCMCVTLCLSHKRKNID